MPACMHAHAVTHPSHDATIAHPCCAGEQVAHSGALVDEIDAHCWRRGERGCCMWSISQQAAPAPTTARALAKHTRDAAHTGRLPLTRLGLRRRLRLHDDQQQHGGGCLQRKRAGARCRDHGEPGAERGGEIRWFAAVPKRLHGGGFSFAVSLSLHLLIEQRIVLFIICRTGM